MKRDIILLVLCLCVLGGVNWLGQGRSASAAVVSATGENWTLILDAGHGGEDGGASTPAGQKESDINLAIVLRTRALMTFLGVEPQLTRQIDISLHSSGAETIRQKKVSDLKNRVALVEGTPNAMLISVHQNHFTDPRYDGTQVFFNGGEAGRLWGEGAQELFRQVLDLSNDRKAKPMPDGIYLFEHVSCPAILVECGFLSNGEEAALLVTDTYQKKVALGLAGAYFCGIQTMPTSLGGN